MKKLSVLFSSIAVCLLLILFSCSKENTNPFNTGINQVTPNFADTPYGKIVSGLADTPYRSTNNFTGDTPYLRK
jgi:hypothetical protein